MSETFNWFETDFIEDVEEFSSKDKKQNLFSKTFDFIACKSSLIFLFFIICRIILFVFDMNLNFKHYSSIKIFFNYATVMSGTFSMIVISCKTFAYILLNLAQNSKIENFIKIYRLLSILCWSIVQLLWIKFTQTQNLYSYTIMRQFFISIMITSLIYMVIQICIIILSVYFVKITLKHKLLDVDKTEKILECMKNFRHEVPSSSSSEHSTCSCKDVFCYDMTTIDNSYERRGLEEVDTKKTFLEIREPMLQSISDAKTLARDVFLKSSEEDDTLNFEKFSAIFSNTKAAISAFAYFDNGSDKTISKKTFHDTIISFYMERVHLEKSIDRAEQFVNIIGNILCVIALCFLLIIYLIIFGFPLKELFALTLSSAIVLNFMGNGLAKDMYYNLLLVLSHQFDIGDEIILDKTEYKIFKYGIFSTSLICENGGTIKFLNSDLWKKTIINMTRAPEKLLVFKFKISPNISNDKICLFKHDIYEYLKSRKFDYFDTFTLQSVTENNLGIDVVECCIIFKCKTFKNKARKFYLRIDITNLIQNLLKKHSMITEKN